MAKVIRNGKAYDGADVTIIALGNKWDEVVELSYSTEQEHQANHTLGSEEATSWSKGKITHTASIKLMAAQASQLEKACGGNLLDIKPFDINVTLVNEYNMIVNDTIHAKFMSQGRTTSTEMGLAQDYQLFAISISYNNI